MIPRPILSLLVAALVATPAAAQKEKRASVGDFPFITGPKGDSVARVVPGLNAVLLLTDEQKEKIQAARQETLGNETLLAAGRKVKENPNATEAEKQAARQAFETAQAQLQEKVDAILTPEQKELIQRIRVLAEQSRQAISAEIQGLFADAKGNEEATAQARKSAQEKFTADFTRRLNEILTPAQREAMEKAAAEEKQQAAEAPKKGK